jgi:hypothetical protein
MTTKCISSHRCVRRSLGGQGYSIDNEIFGLKQQRLLPRSYSVSEEIFGASSLQRLHGVTGTSTYVTKPITVAQHQANLHQLIDGRSPSKGIRGPALKQPQLAFSVMRSRRKR